MSGLPKMTSKLVPVTFAALLLSSCSTFEPDYVACPDISVSEKAERVYVEGIKLGQIAQVRFNGVNARCVATSTGYDMEMELGFLLKRDISDSSLSEEVPLDLTFAYVGENDQVMSRYVHSTSVFFSDYRDKSRPIILINTEIPAGTRVVMGLGKAAE